MNNIIRGKRIDFNQEIIEYENVNDNENNQNIINCQNIDLEQNFNDNKIYNNNNNENANNELYNENNPNIINNNNDDNNSKKNEAKKNSCINNQPNQPLNINIDNSKVKCTCSKTGCTKKYCACLSKGLKCNGCNCKNCKNQPFYKNDNNNYEQNIENIENINYTNVQINNNNKNQRVICNCTKSNCMKKYCECFKQGLVCNSLCRCRECKNDIIKDKNALNNNIQNIENNINLNNNINSFEDNNNNPIIYQSEAFCIFILKGKLKEVKRKIYLDREIKDADFNSSPKFSNRKRGRSRIDLSNQRTCPTSNSNRRRRGIPSVNENIEKKKLQL